MKKTSKFALSVLTTLAVGAGAATWANAGDKTFGDGGDLPDFLKEYDVNEDGVIDEEERQAVKAARKEARAARRAEIDTNGDGKISDEERVAAREAILAEIEAKRSEKFNEIAGQDGVIEPDEFADIPALEGKNPERVAALFDRLDSDDSGTVTLEEFNVRLRNHRGGIRGRHHHPRPPRPRGGNGGGANPSLE